MQQYIGLSELWNKFLLQKWPTYESAKFVKLGQRTAENRSVKLPHPHDVNVLNRQYGLFDFAQILYSV